MAIKKMNLNEQEDVDEFTKISVCNVLFINYEILQWNLKVLLAVVSVLCFDFSVFVEKSTLKEVTVFLRPVPSSSETMWNDELHP